MGRLFGTDGVRGLANRDLTPEVALSLSVAAAHVLAEQNPSHRSLAVVGRDPRASGEMLEAAVIAGLTSAGADVMRLGVLPTPALAYLTAETSADLGVMLSASHNPMPDNGIKLFARGGHKLPDRVEDAIEARMTEEWPRPIGTAIGRIRSAANSHDRYIAHLLATLPNDLAGLRVVVDCAHGAASLLAPEIYRQAGAEVIAIGAEPNGENINDNVGSTHIDGLVGAVAAHQADLGIAHDGDADRCFAVTADGLVVDGDGILAICALAMARTGKLRENTVVTTVMSNLGFHHAMRDHGIKVLTVPVGDRYVLEKLHEFGLSLGGEQSGHIVFPDHATTGDGILTALQLMHQLTTTGKSLAELASVVHRFPQVLINVPVTDRNKAMAAAEVDAAVAGIERELGEDGRVLLRPSGTEQLIRVMVEAPTEDQARTMANQLSEAVLAASK